MASSFKAIGAVPPWGALDPSRKSPGSSPIAERRASTRGDLIRVIWPALHAFI